MPHSDLPRLLRTLTSRPLAVERQTLDAFLSVLHRRSLGASFDGLQLHAEVGISQQRESYRVATRKDTQAKDSVVQVIPVIGTLANRAHSFGPGAMDIAQKVAFAASDPRVSSIVLDVDSPGGTVDGIPELAARIFQARQAKPVVAVANSLMASAAYWISAAAGEIVVAPSGQAGSIGVFTIHIDESEALEAEGLKVTEISAGRYKTEGAPWKPLDEEGLEFLGSQVSLYYDWFVRDVARFRGDSQKGVRGGYGEGRVLDGEAAVAAKLADRIGTLDDTIERLKSGAKARRGARAEHEARKRMRARNA